MSESAARPSSLTLLWPELVAIVGLIGSILWFANASMVRSGGEFTYPLDDTYIHLAIAKNLVEHHIWGVTPHEFTSASSSPLWVLLVAADYLAQGVNAAAPLALNFFAGLFVVLTAGSLWRSLGWSQWGVLCGLVALIAFPPLPTLIVSGMEHTTHVALVIAWVALLADPLRSDGPIAPRRLAALGVLAAALTVCRFESLFLVFVSCAVLFFRGRRREAVILGLCAWASVGVFAAFSIAHGWHALPNSVLVKAAKMDWHSASGIALALGGRSLVALWKNPHLAILLALAAFAAWSSRRARGLLLIFAGTVLLHLQFAQTGWLFRYEAYLIALGVVVLGCTASLERQRMPGWLVPGMLVGLAIPFGWRTVEASRLTIESTRIIHDQQWQVGRFLRDNMGDRVVALNDIGAPSYLSNVHLVDLIGLANMDTAEIQLGSGYSPRVSEALARKHGIELVVVHEDLFARYIPRSWTLIGRWSTPGPLVLSPAVIAFYSTQPANTEELAAKLAEFTRTELPPEILYSLWSPERRSGVP